MDQRNEETVAWEKKNGPTQNAKQKKKGPRQRSQAAFASFKKNL